MNAHVDDSLFELQLGLLAEDERSAVESHLHHCAECRRALSNVRSTVRALDEALPSPSASLRARLFADVDGPLRYAPFAAPLAELWDLPRARAEELLVRVSSVDAFRAGPLPGMAVLPVRPGTRVKGATALFLRGEPATPFPAHRHVGDEHVIVLEGAFRNDDGSVVERGDRTVMPADSRHAFVVTPDGPCVCAFLSYGGFEIV